MDIEIDEEILDEVILGKDNKTPLFQAIETEDLTKFVEYYTSGVPYKNDDNGISPMMYLFGE